MMPPGDLFPEIGLCTLVNEFRLESPGKSGQNSGGSGRLSVLLDRRETDMADNAAMKWGTVKWLAGTLLGCLVLAVCAATLPPPLKKLGLFSILMGVVVACVASQLSQWLQRPFRKWDLWLVVLLAVGTEAGRVLETYRLWMGTRQRLFREELRRAEGLGALLSEQLQQQLQLDWVQFLAQRFQSLPGVSTRDPSPTGMWLGFTLELLLAGLAAGLCWRFWAALDREGVRH